LTRSDPKIRRRSSAFSFVEAMSSWIARASFSASLATVGVVMRSTEATRTFRRTSSWATRQINDDLP
jgi:hypothetical protein